MQVCPEVGQVVSLRRLLPEAEIVGADDVWITGCTSDSRKCARASCSPHCREAAATAAISRPTPLPEAARRCLPERPIAELPVPSCVVPNPRESFARLCQALAGSPSRQLKLIGVTGTNGKTTTSCLIAGVLSAADHRVGVLGTLGYLDGRIVEESTHTTPPPERLASLLSRMVRNGCTHAVMEVSSHALDQSRVAGLEFDAACVTNVTHDHLDYHATLSEYRQAKAKIFDHLDIEGFAVLNADDPGSAEFSRRHAGPALTIGIDSPAEITAVPVEQFASEQTFLLDGRQRNRARADANDRPPSHLQLHGGGGGRIGLRNRTDHGRSRAGIDRARARPAGTDRVRAAVRRFCRFRPHARCTDRRVEDAAASDGGPADLRFRRRRPARQPEAAADGPSRRKSRQRRDPHERQSASRRPAGDFPRRARRIGQPRHGPSDSRSHRRRSTARSAWPSPAIAC